MNRRSAILDQHLRLLSMGYRLSVSNSNDYVIVHGFKLPPGYNWSFMDVLVEIPDNYPLSPPGVASHVYVPPALRYHGRELQDVHEYVTPGWGRWAWFCYSHINWDPHRDDLVRFMEMVRADLTNPNTY